MTFNQNFQYLKYNVTAIAQTDKNGYGPGYLLNGLSNMGYWYQVGVAYNWPYVNGGYTRGFRFIYEVFDDSGVSIYPSSGGGGLISFSGPVHPGDIILLELNFSNGNVVMKAQDWNTGSTQQRTYTDKSASYFRGLSSAADYNGFFTGLMTEWYHSNPYVSSEEEVNYSQTILPLTSATMWMDEYDPSNPSWTGSWSNSTHPLQYTSSPQELRVFSSHNATECSNAYEFISGGAHSLSIIDLNSSKTIVGRSYNTNVTLTIENNGSFDETFNITFYGNDSAFQTETLTLAEGNLTRTQISLNTSSLDYGNYTIHSTLELAPGETNTGNNTDAHSSLTVTIPGDLNGDLRVSLADLTTLAHAYGSKPGDVRWNPNADIDNDNSVDLTDLVISAQNFT
jgi:hypothetical protein